MKYFIKTYGCQMNVADSEKIAQALEEKGYQPAESMEKADLVVINSCSVRQSAENRVFGLVNNLRNLRGWRQPSSEVKRPRIILTGCMVGSALGKRKRYSLAQLKRRLPQVDKFQPIEDLIGQKRFSPQCKRDKAFVSIMRGCDNFCTYCVVPYGRGSEKSRPMEEIYREIKKLVRGGCKEITLLGQNVNSYGKDLKIKNWKFNKNLKLKIRDFRKKYKNNFAVLLALLHLIKGLKRIDFITSNPHDMAEGIIEAMKLPKISRQLHLAVQSGDDQILKKMNRKYTSRQFLDLVKKIKRSIPEIQISTDIIVGFPGETKEQFQNTVELCRQIGFNKAYISKYSPRPGTAAAKLEDNVPYQEKRKRWQILDKLINKSN